MSSLAIYRITPPNDFAEFEKKRVRISFKKVFC